MEGIKEMKLKLPKNPNWEKYQGVLIEGEPENPRCPYCETDGHNFGWFHITKRWVFYKCFLCDDPNGGVFRYQRTNYKPKRMKT